MVADALAASQGAERLPADLLPQRRLSRAMVALLTVYIAVVVLLMVARGAYLSPDLFLIFSTVIAVVLGRTRLFFRDWLPFVAIFLAWESMRGLADNAGTLVHSDGVIALERLLFFGAVPSVTLQAWLYKPSELSALDLFSTSLYIGHFALPMTVGLIFWILHRPMYYRYVLTLMTMSFAAFLCYLLIPVAPPRFSGSFGEALAVHDVARETFAKLGFAPVTTWLYGNINGNAVAAFPSIHSAYPLLAFLFAHERWPRASWGLFAYAAAVWFSVVFLGHHYVVDVLGGIGFALGAYTVSRHRWPLPVAARLRWEPLAVPVRGRLVAVRQSVLVRRKTRRGGSS